jgi:hypothetical protein
MHVCIHHHHCCYVTAFGDRSKEPQSISSESKHPDICQNRCCTKHISKWCMHHCCYVTAFGDIWAAAISSESKHPDICWILCCTNTESLNGICMYASLTAFGDILWSSCNQLWTY